MYIIVIILIYIVIPVLIVRSRKSRFSKEQLQTSEEIIAEGKAHEITIAIVVLLQIVIAGSIALPFVGIIDMYNVVTAALHFVVIIVFCITCWAQATNVCRELVVTNKRVILKVGILSRKTREYRYDKIESCDVEQSIFGRMLNYGTVVIRGSCGSKLQEPYVKNPFKFRQYLIDRIV